MDQTDYVSRGGHKLAAALDQWNLSPAGWVCADLGCNVGGFTDCLLQRGAQRVFAVDTGYGQLAWKLRQDERVVVMERTNALHLDPRAEIEGFVGCDLAVLDLGWTRQQHAIPAALRWLKTGGQIITLIKPHYEAADADWADQPRGKRGKRILDEDKAAAVAERTRAQLPELGVTVEGMIRSPLHGGAGKGKRGNVEYLALVRPA